MLDVCSLASSFLNWLEPILSSVLEALGGAGTFAADWADFSGFVLSTLGCSQG